MLRQVNGDREALAALCGQRVDTLAYPFGEHDDRVIGLLQGTQLAAARTVTESGNFDLPADPLRWAPTAHHLRAEPHLERFLASDDQTPALLLIYGHS